MVFSEFSIQFSRVAFAQPYVERMLLGMSTNFDDSRALDDLIPTRHIDEVDRFVLIKCHARDATSKAQPLS